MSEAAPSALATPEQEAFERRAVRLLDHPVVRAALPEIKDYWRAKLRPDAEHLRWLDAEFEQTAFLGIMNALNQDSDHPRIHFSARFAHQLDGIRVPGTKHAHPNPDYIYYFAPVNGRSRYEVGVDTGNAPPAAAEISLLDKNQVYLGNLSLHQLQIGADGKFTLTLDPDPADGRPNHLQTTQEAFQLLIRNVIGDLNTQKPMRFAIRRVGAKAVPFPSDDAVAPLCAGHIRKLIDDLLFVNANFVYKRPVNHFDEPFFNDSGMYSVTQAYAPGHFALDDDEALVFTLTLGNAAYAVVPVTNIWGGLGDYLHHVGSLGTGRAAPNLDGSYTIVVSPRDPGIRNWVDTGGLHTGVIFVRWAGFDLGTGITAKPRLICRRVKLDALDTALPPGTPRITADERHEQLAAHQADYLRVTG